LLGDKDSSQRPRRRTNSAAETGAETRQWLAIPKPSKSENGTTESIPRQPSRPKERERPARRASRRERALQSKLARAREEVAAQKRQIAKMQEVLDEFETANGASPSKRTAKAPPKRASKPPPKRPAKPRKPKGDLAGKPDLNEVTFEELRGLGLSVTQSARMIAYRDVRGGFGSIDELNGIPGLSRETLAKLNDQLSVSST
jgi:DNA uptake protein ComE-like DNA-binding protein